LLRRIQKYRIRNIAMFSKTTVTLGALALAAQVSAHGHIEGITVNGVYNQGPAYRLTYQNPMPKISGWISNNEDEGYVAPDAYTNADIICHKSSKNGATHIKVAAGDEIKLHWNTWPESHHGPVIDYLAPCENGDCSAVDKESLQFTKIAEAGLIDISKGEKGFWATDDLIANNNTWVTSIPASIAPGKYVLRHEIIALHSAHDPNGAQNYPQCINFEVTSSGTNAIASGTLGTKLYTPTDAGIAFGIHPPKGDYPIPGPKLMAGGSAGGSDDSEATPSASASASAPVASAPAASGSSSGSGSASAPTTVASVSASAPVPSFTAPAVSAPAVTTPVASNTAIGAIPTTLVTKASSATTPSAPIETTPAGDEDEDEDDTTCI
jgi:cellulase